VVHAQRNTRLVVDVPSLDVLKVLLGKRAVTVDSDVTSGYVRDTADLVAAGAPLAVVTARSSDDVQALMRWASAHRVGVVPRGAGTGLSGAATAFDGCVVLDMSRMNRIIELSVEDRLAVVEPGVINADLSTAAGPHGLMYAPDPSSWDTSTIGGNIATNAGGLRCVRYGATRASVLGLDVVLADGRLLRTGGRTAKRSAGYDLTQLMVGSEGTLGIVVSATVRLHPLPPPTATALLTFPAVESAAATAAALVRSGPPPLLLELIDSLHVRTIDALRGTGFGDDVGAVLITTVEDLPRATDLVARIATDGGATEVAVTTDDAEARELLDIRRAAYPSMQQLGRTLVEDVCVPCSRLDEMVAAVEVVGAETGVVVGSVAHAGDGNVHPVLVVPDGDDGEQRLWSAADRIFRTALQLGGTVSGEHGIGRLKRRWLADEIGTTSLDVQQSIKAALDPLGILNPGAIFEPR
jgi:glycolate oxidase